MPLQWLASAHSVLAEMGLNAIAITPSTANGQCNSGVSHTTQLSINFQEISHGLVKKNVQEGQARFGFRFP